MCEGSFNYQLFLSHIHRYGYKSWEWTRNDPIRSPLYHMNFSFMYYILKILDLDTGWMVAYGPKIVQALYAALFDYYYLKLIK